MADSDYSIIDVLPPDSLALVCAFAGQRATGRFSQVCKEAQSILSNESLWR